MDRGDKDLYPRNTREALDCEGKGKQWGRGGN